MTMELPVGGESKRLRMELSVGVKRKRPTSDQQSVVEKRKRLTRDMPEELIIDEIITRLPIKSVGRFRSVSKSWKSLLSGSRFIKEHNIRSPMQNPNDYDCFVAQKCNHIAIVFRDKEDFELPMKDCSLIGSVNGLVCLWNPTIHQSVEFNLPQRKLPTLIGVGFDHVSNDCKLVVCYPLLDSCDVYSSNSNSWIQLSLPEFLMNKFKGSSYIPTTYVKNCPYWTYSTYSSTYSFDKKNYSEKNVKSLAALKFDATSNKLKLLTEFLPDARSRDRGKIFRFVNMRDLLTLMAHEPSPIGKLDVYSLDEEKGCGVWIKMYHVGPFKEFRRFRFMQQGFKYGDEIVFFEFGKLCYYDHKTKTFECLPGKDVYDLLHCFTYTPGLVLLQGMKSIYSDDRT